MHEPGGVLKLKEVESGIILVAYFDDDSDRVVLAKLSPDGTILRKVNIQESDSVARVDAIYEFEGKYGITFSLRSPTSAKYLYQCFEIYDSAMNFISGKRYSMVNDVMPNGIYKYHLDDNHVWSAIYEQSDAFVFKAVKFSDAGVPTVLFEKRFNSITRNCGFIRSFTHRGRFETYLGYNAQLYYYSFDSTYALLNSDSILGFDFIKGADTLKQNFAGSILGDVDVFGENFIATRGIRMPDGTTQMGIFKMNGVKQIKAIEAINLSHESSFDPSFIPQSNVSILGNKIFASGLYWGKSDRYLIYEVDSELQVKKSWKFFRNEEMGLVEGIQASMDGGCFVFGSTFSDSTNRTVYISKIDSNGVKSFVIPISSNRKAISLFPNPGMNLIFGIPDQTTLNLIDISGKQTEFASQSSTIDVSTLHSGIYFYQIINKQGEAVSTGKWVKQ